MKEVSSFQFYRYLTPSGIGLLYYVILCAVFHTQCPPKLLQIDGLGAGLLVVVLLLIAGYAINFIYSGIAGMTPLSFDHKVFFASLQNAHLLHLYCIDPIGPVAEWKEIDPSWLRRSASWAIFDSVYYWHSTKEHEPGDLTNVVMRHEGQFDYLHGTGSVFVGILAATIIYVSISGVLCGPILSTVSLLGFCVLNYVRLWRIARTYVETSMVRLLLQNYTPAKVFIRKSDLKLTKRRQVCKSR